MNEEPRAMVREIDGKIVLDDPDGLAVARAVGKHNCRILLEANAERMPHFLQRSRMQQVPPEEQVIVLIHVDDINGRELANILMPGHDWQQYRDRGEVPIARGLAMRHGVLEALRIFDQEAAEKLATAQGVAVVVVDYGVAEVYLESEVRR